LSAALSTLTDAYQLRRRSLQCSWTSCLDSGTICRRASNSRTCHAAVSDARWRHVYLVSGAKAKCEFPFYCALEIPLLTYLLTYLLIGVIDRPHGGPSQTISTLAS